MNNSNISQSKETNSTLDSVITNQIDIQGLLIALTDLQQTIKDYVFACNQNQTKTNFSELLLQLNHSDSSIYALVNCIQQLNDNNIKTLDKFIAMQK